MLKTKNVIEGEVWVERLAALAPTARETSVLRGLIQQMKTAPEDS